MPTFTNPNSDNDAAVSDFMEKWSDAARAAAAAGRKARGQGTAARKAAASAQFEKSRGKRTEAKKFASALIKRGYKAKIVPGYGIVGKKKIGSRTLTTNTSVTPGGRLQAMGWNRSKRSGGQMDSVRTSFRTERAKGYRNPASPTKGGHVFGNLRNFKFKKNR